MTLGDFRKQTDGLPDSIELNTVVNLSNEASEYEDILDCTVELHHLDNAEKNGSIDIFVYRKQSASNDYHQILYHLQSEIEKSKKTLSFSVNTLGDDGIFTRIIPNIDSCGRINSFNCLLEHEDGSSSFFEDNELSDDDIRALAAEINLAKPVNCVNDEIAKQHEAFVEKHGHEPKYVFLDVRYDNDERIFPAVIKLRDYDKENTELDPDDAYIEFYTDGLPELLQINSERIADFVITDIYDFSDNLF